DLILQYARFLKKYYEERGAVVNKVRAEVYVTLNARPSKLLISDQQNLLELTDSWQHKNWILPFETK
ncbi:MAG: HTTM domain-containing protein, partial [Bacteroidota bacterium]